MESAWATVFGLRVHARVWRNDSAPPIVLVHGVGVSSRYFVPVARELAKSFYVLAPDLPGHGRSERPRTVLDVPQLADALGSWLDAVRLPRATFLGNSMGCQVLIDLAARRPETVDRAILAGPTPDPDARTLPRQFARLVLGAFTEPLSLDALVVYEYLRTGPIRSAREGKASLADRPEDKVADVAAPTLVVRGERDTLVSREWAESLATRLPNGTFAEIRGAGHAVNYNAPRELFSLVNRFTRRDSRQGRLQ